MVICDEAHRTQYGFKGKIESKRKEAKYGLAKGLKDTLSNEVFFSIEVPLCSSANMRSHPCLFMISI